VFACGPDGKASSGDETIRVFDSLEAARVHTEAAVKSMPRLCAQIYGYRGRAGDPVEQVYHKSLQRRFDRRRQARNEWLTIWGPASDRRLLWLYLIELKLFVVGSLLTARGVGWILGQKKRALSRIGERHDQSSLRLKSRQSRLRSGVKRISSRSS
jgi:hypothetical protein